MAEKYKAAIVGCGRIASLFAEDKKRRGISTHAQAYQAHPRTELVAACDLDRDRLLRFGKKWGVRRLYTDFTRMMREEKPQLVSICTWNASHERLVFQAVQLGARGVVCEKPIADALAAAGRMTRLCRQKRVPLLVNYSRRYNELHSDVQRLIESGSLGRIQTVSCYYTAGLVNTGTHLFDILRFFFGDLEWVWANPQRVLGGADPTADLYLFFKRGFGCTISALDVAQYMQFEIDIYGTRCRLRLEDSGMKMRLWRVAEHPVYSGYKTLEPSEARTTDFSQNLYRLVDNLVGSVERKTRPLCSGDDGEKTLEIACAARLSLKQRRLIRLPLKNRSMRLTSK